MEERERAWGDRTSEVGSPKDGALLCETVPKVYGIETKGVLFLSESRRPELV